MQENQKPAPGQIIIRRRAERRQKFEAVKAIQIHSAEDAITFVSILSEKLPEITKVLKRSNIQQVYQNNQRLAPKAPEYPSIQSTPQTPVSDERVDTMVKPAPSVSEEQVRIEQMRAAAAAEEEAKKELPEVPTDGLETGPVGPVEEPEQTGDVLTEPTGLPMNPDEETEMSRSTPVEPVQAPAPKPKQKKNSKQKK